MLREDFLVEICPGLRPSQHADDGGQLLSAGRPGAAGGQRLVRPEQDQRADPDHDRYCGGHHEREPARDGAGVRGSTPCLLLVRLGRALCCPDELPFELGKDGHWLSSKRLRNRASPRRTRWRTTLSEHSSDSASSW